MMIKNISLLSLAAVVATTSTVDAAAFGSLKRRVLNGKIQVDGSSLRGSRGQQRRLDGHLIEGCTVTSVLVLGEHLFNDAYSYYSYNTTLPLPGDRELYNLPLIDPEPYLNNNGTISVLGYVNENVVYLPDGPIPASDDPEYEPECHGVETWTFWDQEAGVVTGQVSDQFSCRGFTQTVITGGTHDYMCAEGNAVETFLSEDFYDGSGYAIYDIQNCGLCDTPSLATVEKTSYP